LTLSGALFEVKQKAAALGECHYNLETDHQRTKDRRITE